MRKTIQFGVVGLGVALLGAGLTESGAAEAVRRGVQAVFVTNGPNHPVPVVLQGDLVATVGASLTHLLGPATAAGATYSVSNALRLYADPGTTVTFQVSIQTATGSVDYVLANLSGYLVDA
jgi:hypothetical protein